MELVDYKNEILHKECEKFDFSNPPFEPVEFSVNLVKFMYEHNALGIAANQIGIPYKIFAMRGSPENFVCFNPRIIDKTTEEVLLEEGCLSYPDLIVKVKRPKSIKVRFNTPNGDVETKTFTGLTARIFQHEFDHLYGINFLDLANKFHRDQAMRKWKK